MRCLSLTPACFLTTISWLTTAVRLNHLHHYLKSVSKSELPRMLSSLRSAVATDGDPAQLSLESNHRPAAGSLISPDVVGLMSKQSEKEIVLKLHPIMWDTINSLCVFDNRQTELG